VEDASSQGSISAIWTWKKLEKYDGCLAEIKLEWTGERKFYIMYRGVDKSLARPGRKQALKHIRDSRDFNNIEMRAMIKFFFLQGKAPKEIQAILTETLACFFPGRAKDLSAPL